jgi:PAS domain S-box-containing protein
MRNNRHKAMPSKPAKNDTENIDQCLRDVVALSTLPAIWSGADPLRIAESLAAALFTTLDPEFVYVSFPEGPGRPPVAVAQTDRYETSVSLAEEIGSAIFDWARAHDPDELLLLPNPLGSGTLGVVARSLGAHAELGVVAAGFADESSPTWVHHLLLNVGASQAVTAIQNAHLLRSLRETEERARHANAELAQHVTELQRANIEIQDSRRAALNVMEDAIHAKEALRQRTGQFETLLNEAPLGVYLVDADFRIREVNPTAVPVFGDIPDLIGRDFDEVIHILWPKRYADEIVKLFRHTLQTGEPYSTPERIEQRLDRGVTEYYEWQINRIPLPDGRYGVVCYFRDISAQVFARQKIADSEERFRGIVNQSIGGIAETDSTGRFTLVNDRYCDIVGYSREELLTLRMQEITHTEDLPLNLELVEKLATEGTPFEIEKRYVRKDGSIVWVHNSVSGIRDANGNPQSLIAVSIDITERKRMEKDLLKLNTDLENRVLERTGELLYTIAQREKLQDQLLQAQKMESVGTLASGVAHDFNNLLNIILSYTTLMRLDGKNPARISEGVAVIEETVGRGATLVQQLMSLGRKSEPKFESVRLNSTAGELATLLKQTFSKTFVITLDLERGLPAVNGDENQLHQALLNLCVNARDAMPEGGRISLKTETVSGGEVRRRFPEAEADCYASFSVSDNGSGMDDATQRRIFEPFFTTKPLGQGTGLGLAVVYGIVKNHNGFIEVKSKLGQGTTFCIYLPIHKTTKEQPSQTNGSGSAQRPVGHGETILFVDDEEKQLNVMRRFLESEGYKVLAAKDGVEAVEMFRRRKEEIAVAVLDLGLPKVGGWHAFQQMREIRADLKALIATGFVSPQVEAEMAQGKLAGVIVKPYHLDDVLEKISRAIGS